MAAWEPVDLEVLKLPVISPVPGGRGVFTVDHGGYVLVARFGPAGKPFIVAPLGFDYKLRIEA